MTFKSRGLKVGLYDCGRHPGFMDEFKVLPPECDPATHSREEQIGFQTKQIVELLEKYPDVFYFRMVAMASVAPSWLAGAG